MMLVPTPRLLLIGLLGVFAVILSGSHDLGLAVAVLWLAGTVVLALVDGFSLPPAETLHWKREHDDKLSLGDWNRVTLTLESTADRPATLEVRDAAPRWLLARGETGAGVCPARGAWSLRYDLFPLRRGDYRFGPVTARYLGPLGLVWRQRPENLGDEVKVYPNLLAIRNYEALVHRGRMSEFGLRHSRVFGEGTEYERLRSYTPDDEYRRVNWKATARRGQPIVVDYQTERSQNVILALDAGRLMATRLPLPGDAEDDEGFFARPDSSSVKSTAVPAALTRLDYSLNAALLLSFVAQEYGDRIGMVAFSDRVKRFVRPRAGRRQFLLLTQELYNLEADPTATDFAEAIAYLATKNPRRSLIVFFTDFAEPDAASQLISHIGHLVPRHLPLVVTLQDPSIERLASMDLTGTQSVYERAVAARLLAARAETLLQLRHRGVLTLDVAADKLNPSVINRYLEVKARSRL